MAENFTYDAFITYASVDTLYAKQLYDLLTAIGQNVFLDSEALIGGDTWPKEIMQAQQDAFLTLILISDHIDSASFAQHEILSAIEIAKEDPRRRIIPLFLVGKARARKIMRRLQLKQFHGLFWEEGSSLLTVIQKIEAALKDCKRYQEYPQEIVIDTIVIVTGCYHRAEIFDRPSAYELKMSIDRVEDLIGRPFLRSIVMGDIWFCDHSHISGHPNVISIGSPGINNLSRILTEERNRIVVKADGQWQIVRVGNRVALFGDRAEDTYAAVHSFKERDLRGFLGEVWSHLLNSPF